MKPAAAPRASWPFLITPGVSAPARAAIIPAPVVRKPELLLDWVAKFPPIDTVDRRRRRVRLSGLKTGWVAYRRTNASSDNLARIRDRQSNSEIRLSGHAGRVTACAFSADEKLVVTAGWDRSVRLWSAADGRPLATIAGHDAWVSGVAFSPDDRYILSAAWDGGVRAFAIGGPTGTPTTWRMSAPLIIGCLPTPDGRHLVCAGADNLIRIVDLTRPGTAAAKLLDGHHDEITTCALSPDGHLIASGSRDRNVIVWDFETGKRLAVLPGHQDWVSGVTFSSDSRWVISSGWDGRLMRWKVGTSDQAVVLEGHPARFTSCVTDPRQEAVITTDADGALRRWGLQDGRCLDTHEIGRGTPGGCAVSKRGRYVGILSLNDDPVDAHPALDSAGRPITMTEGVLCLGRPEPSPLTDSDLTRLHAIALSGFGRYAATESYGGAATVGQEITFPGSARPHPGGSIPRGTTRRFFR